MLVFLYTLRENAVQTQWTRRARRVHAVDALWQLLARHVRAVSAPRERNDSPTKTQWGRRCAPWALRGNATIAVRTPWHLHLVKNEKYFATISSIFWRSHGALEKIKSQWPRRGIAVECDRGLSQCYISPHWHGIILNKILPNFGFHNLLQIVMDNHEQVTGILQNFYWLLWVYALWNVMIHWSFHVSNDLFYVLL